MWRDSEAVGESRDLPALTISAPVPPAPASALTCVYSGVWTQAIPDELIRDTLLKASEVRIWCVLRTYLKNPAEPVSPTYDDLCIAGNMARATLSRGLKVLRLTRWLTARLQRDAIGLTRGAIYILHDRRLDTGSVMMLDPRYPAFVAQCAVDEGDDRVRKMALLMAEQLPELYQQVAPTVPEWIEATALGQSSKIEPLHATAPAAEAVRKPVFAARSLKSELPTSGATLATVADGPPIGTHSSGNELRKSSGSSLNELRSDSRSSCSSGFSSREKNTTTTNEGAHATAWTDELKWPECLLKHRALATQFLAELSFDQRSMAQDLLDELAGQFRTGKVQRPLSYLGGLVRKARTGGFLPTEHTADARRRRQREAEIAEDHARFAADPNVGVRK